jgi:hypothetical protein
MLDPDSSQSGSTTLEERYSRKNYSDQPHLNSRKTKRLESIVPAAVEKDNCNTAGAFFLWGHQENFSKMSWVSQMKSARWVLKLLSDKQKQQNGQVSGLRQHGPAAGKSVLDNIVTKDESAVSFHTPETKKQSKQRVK